ncbi:class I SAM-dependent methyltransferase [Sandaracinus amylolyticus]|uniref:Cyclopropane-fatty-acyl-phospholipid synthase n=1 Tax=Sandaracinus amylolyticus TaxID=927083 RepID=A0A0F6W3D2_9BACT|nr:class I SAM-dependent methyltransferase [Sandaracinus amylolyticus]AKF06246.1 Cyclopropane-fatty-acyl-phospholipid synthase [Sandaracinus amylolyticus]
MTSTQAEIDLSYSVSNEFFKLWLDENMHYTSASFFTGKETLEEAQIQKSRVLYEYAEMTPDKLVLDIGCGWGSNLLYHSTRGTKVAHGITLSTGQCDWANQKMNLPETYEVKLQDFWKYEPAVKYDALQSIEMIDHVVSPQQSTQGLAIDLYRNYFERCWHLAKPGAWFGFQAILRDRVPRNRKDLEDLKFTADVIFPGGLNPRLEELIVAIRPFWECVEMRTQRESYGKTTGEWLRRLRENEREIRKQWGDQVYVDYERYLDTCVRAFANHWSSDVQMKLRRCDL